MFFLKLIKNENINNYNFLNNKYIKMNLLVLYNYLYFPNLINFEKYYLLYNFFLNYKFFSNKNDFYGNIFYINLKSLKLNICFFNKNKTLISLKPGVILKIMDLKEKKLKKSWKINKFLLSFSFGFLKKILNSKNFILYINNINNYVFRLILFFKKNKILEKKQNLLILNSKYKNNEFKLKKIKSIKKKFKKNFFKNKLNY